MRIVTAVTVALALGGVSGAHAQAPYLVKDIWPGFGFGSPTAPVELGPPTLATPVKPAVPAESCTCSSSPR